MVEVLPLRLGGLPPVAREMGAWPAR